MKAKYTAILMALVPNTKAYISVKNLQTEDSTSCDMVITDIGLYSDTIPETQITISEMEFVDNGRSLEFSPPNICVQEDGHVDEK